MATFSAASLSVAVDMINFFAWAPLGGFFTIDDITVTEGGAIDDAVVTDFGAISGGDLVVTYKGPGVFTNESTDIPATGTFTEVSVTANGTAIGAITGITPAGNFAEIVTNNAWLILFGDDDINGSDQGDPWLFTGDAGNDTVFGKGGADIIAIPVVTGAPSHFIDGGSGNDTINLITNFYSAADTLDLRGSTVQFIEGIRFFNSGLTAILNSSQLNATNVSLSSTITGTGVFHVVKNQAGTLDLSALNVESTVSVVVDGTSGDDFIFGTGVADRFRAGAGADTVNGNGGVDIFEVTGSEALSDAMNGGAGSDALKVTGAAPLVLNGFSATTSSIEVWEGNGQNLLGNGNANIFDLAGLTSMTGLPFVEGLAGNDTLTGSSFIDHLLGGDGNDGMNAGAGDDELEGGLGVDTMTGGLGSDRFDFDAVAEIGKKKGLLDLITDFTAGDTIDLSSIDANGSKKGDKTFNFLKKEGAALTKAGQVGFDQKKGNTFVQGDTNGDGKADFKLQAAGTIDFVKADFVL
jgi:Ca2+-binding RTX toxin-like protein